MSTHLVCPICGQEFECKGPHDGPHDVLSPMGKCPLEKGGIHVFVKDNFHNGVPKVKTVCNKTEPVTDRQGFAIFDQLPEATYTTAIDVEGSEDDVSSKYYASTRISVQAAVKPGKITIVEFALNEYGAMLLKLERTDGESELPPAKFTVSSLNHAIMDPTRPAAKGQAEYKQLKPTELYTVACELHEDSRKNFKLEELEKAGQTVTAAKVTPVVFRVTPRYWIELALIYPKNDKLTGSFQLGQQGQEARETDPVGREFLHVPDLQPGTVDVLDVVLPKSLEFESLA